MLLHHERQTADAWLRATSSPQNSQQLGCYRVLQRLAHRRNQPDVPARPHVRRHAIGLFTSYPRTSHPGSKPARKHRLHSGIALLNGQPSSPGRRQRHAHVLQVRATAAAPAASTGDQKDATSQRRWHVPNMFSVWDRWWELGANDQAAESSQSQGLGDIVSKLWRLMRVNRLLLGGAFIFMVPPRLC